jgi:hypothetical protein
MDKKRFSLYWSDYMKKQVSIVKAMPGYKLHVAFDDGISGIIDLKDFISKGIFSVLNDEQLFNKVYANDYSIAWSDELEIDSLNVYAEVLNINSGEIYEVFKTS